MPTIVEHVEDWYATHLDRLKTEWRTTSLRSFKSPDPIHRKVEIRAESASVAASITFWNSGNVTALRLDLPTKRDFVIEDRKLSPTQDVGFLLDSYFRQFALNRSCTVYECGIQKHFVAPASSKHREEMRQQSPAFVKIPAALPLELMW